MSSRWVVIVEFYRPGGEAGIGEPFVYQVQGDQEAARAAATTEALVAWGQANGMKRRTITRVFELSPDQWLFSVEGGMSIVPRWVRVSVAEAVRLRSDHPWRS